MIFLLSLGRKKTLVCELKFGKIKLILEVKKQANFNFDFYTLKIFIFGS